MVLVDAASGRGYIGANPEKLKIVGEAIKSEEFGFIYPKGSDLIAPIDAALETMLQDGFIEHLNTKWFFFYDPNR
jgi:ABC-type amino acid transport substrate-binding protein